MPAATIVFDLDGTLVDTAPDLVATLNALFARRGLRPVPYAQARNMIGGGARRMIERGLLEENVKAGPDEVDRLVEEFIADYANRIAELSRPFPGVETALDRLAAAGCNFAICTNKLEWLSVRLIAQLGLTARFAAICGQDTFKVQKPDPVILRRTLARAGVDLARAVMVGDSGNDIDAARGAGIPVVAVDFGYTEIPVSELAPDRIISHFADLPAAVKELIPRLR
ncbi:MAG TPA: phosphoglycolate phosphatase [Xanthobacteraceae bacterium]|nr:phosphoglycolate phosphatase [Xanthobacteraceae bacterium]